jgi:hypothetical protein
MNSTLLIPRVAGAGVACSFLLRATMSRTAGITMTSPKATHFVALNAICFWIGLVLTALVCLALLLRRSH